MASRKMAGSAWLVLLLGCGSAAPRGSDDLVDAAAATGSDGGPRERLDAGDVRASDAGLSSAREAGRASADGSADARSEPGSSEAGTSGPDAGDACAPVFPSMRDGKYVLTLGELSFEVDPSLGGRITTFALGGRNLLTSAAVNPDNWGATLWTAPQSAWSWPPPAAYDTGRYSAKLEGAAVVLESAITTAPYRVQVEKRFELDRAIQAVRITYLVRNRGDGPLSVAPWEISRHAGGGLTFFPRGSSVVGAALPVVERDELVWYESDPAAVRAEFGEKYAADGAEGWVAHSDHTLLLVKSFVDLAPSAFAPGHGEVEIYANRPATAQQAYVEVEVVGPHRTLAPGESIRWQLSWSLARLPRTEAALGDAQLVQLARQLHARRGCLE